jgi:negative regulator of sigma E activity
MKIDQEDFNRKAKHIIETVVKPQVKRYERQRQKEEYSFYVTGVTIVIAVILVMCAMVQQLFFK